MNLSELQAELRHFAAERDWKPFHTPKNLSTALMVEAAELAEIFQWMTPEESRAAHEDAEAKVRIGEEVADVLLYLLQVADHSEIDIARAVKSKLALNALKYPAKQTIARVSPARASVPGTHVLLDYENVQPTGDELRAMVPDAGQVWVFHGPHQRQVEQRFASFGADVTVVPISKTGKNALDFHLSFYMGYIASRNQASAIVVMSNDKGYEPMLEHARAMGFAVRQQGHGQAKPNASKKAAPAKAGAAAKPGARKTAAKKAATQPPAVKRCTSGQEGAREEGGADEEGRRGGGQPVDGQEGSRSCASGCCQGACFGGERREGGECITGLCGDDQEADRQSPEDGRSAADQAGVVVAVIEIVLGCRGHGGSRRGRAGPSDRRRRSEGGLREGRIVSRVRRRERVRCPPGLKAWCGIGWCGMWRWWMVACRCQTPVGRASVTCHIRCRGR